MTFLVSARSAFLYTAALAAASAFAQGGGTVNIGSGSFTIVRSSPVRVSPADASRLLTGNFVGETDCPTGVGMEFRLEVMSAPSGATAVGVKGDLRTYGLPGRPHSEDVKTPVSGTFALTTGLLRIQDDPPPPDPCLTHIAGQCIVSHSSAPAIDKMFAERAERKRAEYLARVHLRLDAVRADSGQGWFGTVRGTSYGCPVVKFHRRDDPSTTLIPTASLDLPLAIIADMVSTVDPLVDSAGVARARLAWLNFGADRGDTHAMETLGEMYEIGNGVDKNWDTALHYFNLAADHGDAQVQAKLAGIYAAGDRVPKDQAESERRSAQSKSTKEAAAQLCFSPAAVSAYYALLNAERNDPVTRTWEIFAGMLTGVYIDEGNFLISQVAAGSVRQIDRPFTCLVEGHVLGRKISNLMPRQEVVGYDSDGNVYIRDNSAEVAIRDSLIGIVNMAANQPVVRGFTLERVAERRYRISLNGQPPYMTEAQLTASSSASAPATLITAVSSNVPPATGSPATLPGNAAATDRSVEGNRSTTIRFINRSGSSVKAYWKDYKGVEVFYLDIPPGGEYIEQTFVTHPWIVRDAATGKVLLQVVGTERPQDAIIESASAAK